MPVVVRAVGVGSDHTTLPIPERQALIAMDEAAEPYWAHILFYRVEGARWITCDPELHVTLDDLTAEEVVPLGPDQRFPVAGRPILAFDLLNDAALATIRLQAAQLAEIHGVALGAVVPAAGAAPSTSWYFADPAYAKFGAIVPHQVVGAPALARLWGSVGLVQVDDGDGPMVTSVERLGEADREAWLRQKREGAGRDRRLLKAAPPSSGRLLFRTASDSFDASAVADASVFEGPASINEVVKAISSSGVEPAGYLSQWLTSSGVPPRSGTAVEMQVLVYTIWSMAVVDRLDLGHLASAEHLARRFLQIQRAVKKSPKQPDYSGLDVYMRHMSEITPTAYAPHFDKFIAGTMKDEAVTMKSHRMNLEETDAVEKRKQKKGAAKGSDAPQPG